MLKRATTGDLLARLGDGPVAGEIGRLRRALVDQPGGTFLVGGVVRDLLLERPSRDLDLVVERDLDGAIGRLASALGGEVRRHPQFLTATVTTAVGVVIDLGRARRESYPVPGGLPVVEPGTLREDLLRRDFSVNALALPLAWDEARVLDLCGGIEDLGEGLLRILHPASFLEDPTRLLRGVRLAVELEFGWEAETRRRAEAPEAARALGEISGFRLWRELRLCFTSPVAAAAAVKALAEIGLLSAIHPGLTADRETLRRIRLQTAPKGESTAAIHLLAAWAASLPAGRRGELVDRLSLTRSERRRLKQTVPVEPGGRPGE